MVIRYDPLFEREFRKLPRFVQEKARDVENLFREDPFDARLRTHKLHGELKAYWSFWVDRRYRIMFCFQKDQSVIFLRIGDHDIYD